MIKTRSHPLSVTVADKKPALHKLKHKHSYVASSSSVFHTRRHAHSNGISLIEFIVSLLMQGIAICFSHLLHTVMHSLFVF